MNQEIETHRKEEINLNHPVVMDVAILIFKISRNSTKGLRQDDCTFEANFNNLVKACLENKI